MLKLILIVIVIAITINLAFGQVIVSNPDGTLTQCIVNNGVVTCF